MKRVLGILTAVFLFVGFLGNIGSDSVGFKECRAAEVGPVVALATPLVKMSKTSEVVIMLCACR